jgi:hypothetical protein
MSGANDEGSGTGAQRWEVRDRYGNRIYLSSERWEHAVEQRPWLEGHREDVLQALRQGRRRQDPLDPRKYKYYWPCNDLLPEYSHLVVVVRFGEAIDAAGRSMPNNYVLTIWSVFIYGTR